MAPLSQSASGSRTTSKRKVGFFCGVALWFLCVLSSMFAISSLGAATPEEKGLAIAMETKQRDLGWGDMQAQLRMILRNREGEESLREIELRALEQEDDGDKSLNIFNSPRDVKGTAFLSYSHPLTADEQWLYLPALKRVKRIASRNKAGPFMGSEFAYEDLASFEVEKFTYRYLGDESCDGASCLIVEQYPADEYSGYARRIVWLDKRTYRPCKIVFYDRNNVLLKTLSYSGYRRYSDKHWRADKMLMINHQTGNSTELFWLNYRFKTGLTEQDFTLNALQRVR